MTGRLARHILIWATGLAAAAAGAAWWRAETRRTLITAGLPPAPAVAFPSEELRLRIGHARARAVRLAGAAAALGELSRLYHANGFLREATRCYTLLEQLDPREPRWPHRLATIEAGFGASEPALARWARVQALAPDYLPAQLRRGDLLLKTNRPEQAATVFQHVLQRAPEQPHALLGLARIDFEAGRWAEARRRLETVVAKTDYTLGYDLIVTVYEKLALPLEAARVRGRAKASGAYRDVPDPWLDELLDDCFDAYPLSLAAGAAQQTGDLARAAQLLERAVALAPRDVAVRFQLAGVYAAQRDLRRAREHFEQCTVIAPDFADGWAHLSAVLKQGGDAAGAERVLAAGLAQCPTSPGLHLMRARSHRAAGRSAAAIASYEASIRFRPNEADAYLELANVLFQAERVDDGLKRLHQALAAEPDHPMALGVLALHAIGTGDEPAARRWLERMRAQPRVPAPQAEQLLAAYRQKFGRSFR